MFGCPGCRHAITAVKDSRPCEDGGAGRRRRLCPVCGTKFTTFERVKGEEPVVVSKVRLVIWADAVRQVAGVLLGLADTMTGAARD